MSIPNFYNEFHKDATVQSKLINNKNITYRIIISELINLPKLQNLDILDYGCGVGTISFYLASRNNKVTGVDISNNAILIANKSKYKLKLEDQCNFYNIKNKYKYAKNLKYDLIICSEVIEHVKNDIGLINFLKKLLKTGGYLLITTPSLNAPLYKYGLLEKFDEKVGHLRRYTNDLLEEMLIAKHFKIIFSNKTEGILRNYLYTSNNFGFLLKFLKGYISDIFTFIDNKLIPVFGESNIHILAQKI